MKGSSAGFGSGKYLLNIAEGIEWFVSPVNGIRTGAKLVDYSSVTLDTENMRVSANTVPEPRSFALIPLGLLGIGISRRRRAAA